MNNIPILNSYYKQTIIIFLLTFLSPAILFSQEDSSACSYRMMARPTHDSVMLRWAPVNYESWRKGINCGYKLVRYTLLKNGTLTSQKHARLLTREPLKPYPPDIWEALAETDDYAGVAAQAIYGDDFTPEPDNESTVMTIFNKATEQQNRFAFSLFAADVSNPVARAMGLYFADHDVKPDEKYVYLVFPACHDSLPCDTAFAYTGTDEYVPLVKPAITEVIRGNNTVTLQWKSPEGRWGYTSFEIQRSADNGQTFAPVNTAPLVNTFPDKILQDFNFYIDSLPDNDHRYMYKIRGINPFGEKGPFSDTISVQGKEPLSAMPHISKHETRPEGVWLEWEFDKEAEKLIHGFKVMRSANSKSGFVPVADNIPAGSRNYTDTRPISTAYYKITAWGDKDVLATSFPVLVQLIDSIPPAPPTGLQGKADTTGLVTIRWKANTESDIYGYRVYRANSRDEEFSQLTVAPIRDTVFKDHIVIKTLTPHVYYKIMAIDKRQNYSAFSEALDIKRPDVIPPVAPIIRDVYSSKKGVNILWVHSSSPDKAKEYVLRRRAGTQAWEQYADITLADSLYTDSLGIAGTRYEYALQAIDESRLTSVVDQVVTGLRLATYDKKPVLKAEARRTESIIVLHWEPLPGGRFMIYRAEDDGRPGLYTATDGSANGYTDKKIKPGHTYRYLLKYMGEKGVVLSNEVIVNY